MEDRISALPDDVLREILLQLTLNEAVATSVLSKRWCFLWTSPFSLDNFHYRPVSNLMDADAYVRMVNQIIRQYKGPCLHEFNFLCVENFSQDSNCYIGQWIAFAIANGVSTLKLEFGLRHRADRYRMPPDLFDETSGVEAYLRQLGSTNLTSSLPRHSYFKTIKVLWLSGIDIGDEFFEAILSRCSSLEHLLLMNIGQLKRAKNALPHPKLSCVEMYFMDDLETLELFAPSLISFKYLGRRIHSCFVDCPRLVDVIINSSGPFDYQFVPSQLEYLTMNAGSFLDAGCYWERRTLLEVPVFSSLIELSILVIDSRYMPGCYHAVVSFLEISLFLQRLELHLPSIYPEPCIERGTQELKLTPVSLHRNLKEVLISGFLGDSANVVFVVYILDHAPALEKIEITTGIATWSTNRGDMGFIERNWPDAKNCSPQLLQRLPPRAQLIFPNP